MKKVLITGACGYLGAKLSKHLAENGNSVTVFDSFDPSGYVEWTSLMSEIISGDIRDETTLSSLTNKQFDIVIHLISLDHHRSKENPNFVSSINVMPTWNLLNNFTKQGLEKFIYFSTIHVYGKLPNKIINEDHSTEPFNIYGLTHLLSENICNYFNGMTDTKCINVRLSNSYGSPVFSENNCWWLVVNDLCKTAFHNKKINLLSDGSPQRDFIHISDVCKAIKILINTDQKNMTNNTFHISSGNTITILELTHIIKKIYQDRYKCDLEVIFPENLISGNSDKLLKSEKYIINNTKIKSLGFKPVSNIKTGIEDIFDYLEKNLN